MDYGRKKSKFIKKYQDNIDKSQNIEDVEIGEMVSSYNRDTNKVEYRKVTNLFTQEHLREEDDLTVKLLLLTEGY